jgi:hypothetical protein
MARASLLIVCGVRDVTDIVIRKGFGRYCSKPFSCALPHRIPTCESSNR